MLCSLDPTVTYCPRALCNAPVLKESNDEYERLRICPVCGYSFCVYCRRTYHGTKSRCVFNHASSIVEKYVNGSDEEKRVLESKYGRSNVKKLVEVWLEEQANAKWIQENSTRCPDCQVRMLSALIAKRNDTLKSIWVQLDIERSIGCAHMTCARCSCHFCFRCGSRLSARDPVCHSGSTLVSREAARLG